ncbi:MAG TPA: hypothetical protein DEQ20_07860 [Desulfobulbaceae bacterium]|nr:MAG: hypothetical protein A2520_08180 [Deltaproteobacteria bacterium RIFOXYD12_FULL_53_23]HCC54821.1 hypothetical protein [Desulfobulbaceae bacterium]
MQRIIVGLLLITCCGCSGGIYNNLVEMEMRLASPVLGVSQRVPVVYFGRGDVLYDPMMKNGGLAWRSMERDYSDYNFNP